MVMSKKDKEIYKDHLISLQKLDPNIIAIPDALKDNQDWLKKIKLKPKPKS